MQDYCSRVMGEVPLVKQCLARANNLYKQKNFEEALALIIDCRFLPEIHHKLMETKVYCLKALRRDKEAYEGAHYLWQYGYKMPRKLCQIIGDWLKQNKGHEMASGFYECLSVQGDISNADQQFYRKLMKEIDRNNRKAEEPLQTTSVKKTVVETTPKEQTIVEKIEVYKATTSEVDEKTNKHEDSRITTCEISLELKFLIGKYIGGIYKGRMSCQIFDYPKSFFEPSSSQIKNVDVLRDLGSNNEFIVTIDHLIDSELSFELLVGEPVVPVDYFFQMQLKSFQSGNNQCGFNEGAKTRWWKQIAECFIQIFGDVIHGLIYLYSLGYICGDMKKHIYVNVKGQGKILPLLDHKRTEDYDIKSLIGKMQEIITLPLTEDIVDESYNLPEELMGFLVFVTPDKLKHIPCFWLVNHPFFWSSKERVDFIMDLKVLIKEGVLDEADLNDNLIECGSFASQDEEKINWITTVEDGVFKNVYDRPQTMTIKPYDPRRPVEIVRFMAAGYNHVNDRVYRHLLTGQKSYTQDYIERCFRSFFPKVYLNLYEALYHYASDMSPLTNKANSFKAFEKWSSLYFAKKTSAISKAKGKEVFRFIQTKASITKPVSPSVSKFSYVDRVPDKQSLSPSLRALSRCAQNLGNRLIVFPVEEKVMNRSQSLYFGQEEIVQLLTKDKMDASHISTYIRLLYEDCVAEGLTNTFGFLCPSSISLVVQSKDAEVIRMDKARRSEYIVSALYAGASNGKVFLAPYNAGSHWILCVIDPCACIVYHLDPLRGQREIEQDVQNVIDTALLTYWNQTERSTTWKCIQCPQQNNDIDCGYYVLRFMREIVNHQLIEIPETYFTDCASQNYDQGQINEVRDELACHVLRFSPL